MPEITEETLVQRLCDPKRYEAALEEVRCSTHCDPNFVLAAAIRALHATIASLSEAAADHDERLKAEGAAEAWRSLARNIRADSVFAKSARNPEFLDAFADEEIAEAARLREEAGR